LVRKRRLRNRENNSLDFTTFKQHPKWIDLVILPFYTTIWTRWATKPFMP
jgi:hypothetical protein